jgi:site-specific DNA recombinase
MKDRTSKGILRCAIYTRVSTDQGLEQDFNSLDAQREASEAYVKSQAHEGWRLMREHYDDGGYSRRVDGPTGAAEASSRRAGQTDRCDRRL